MTNKSPFDVRGYSLDALRRMIQDLSPINSAAIIGSRSHPAYLDSYLRPLGVKTVVVEGEYIDRDYLEDFADYYVKCFKDYGRHCGRLHFFDIDFDASAFKSVLSGSTDQLTIKKLQDAYCGYVVVKPLPQTIIGRTCLKTYPRSSTRDFPAARRFSAHLFGIHLPIDSTLPFQEQDNVVAACATSALWSVFQATALEFQHSLMTPVEITRAATEHFPADTRMIPNRGGLSTAMMAHAIRAVGLEPLLFTLPRHEVIALQATLYAYLSGRIPVLMGVGLYDLTRPEGDQLVGHHAVAVSGYNLTELDASQLRSPGFRLRAARINKIYAHDDQIGPFARMGFDGQCVNFLDAKGAPDPAPTLSTSWPARDGSAARVRALPTILLVPLYHKIRIPYEDAFSLVFDFDGFLLSLRNAVGEAVLPMLEWDIRIADINDVKQDLLISGTLSGAERFRWLTNSMPRYLWRATASSDRGRVFDILLDATDIHTNDGVHAVVNYDPALATLLATVASNPQTDALVAPLPGARKIVSWYRQTASVGP